ncbi:MAG: MtaA/CmuA family methyltransferase [Actinobacteria bacterium]|nr:MtaA/CmuA family methyltransferase [Cyanobacteriota bacterium]MCL5771123.1 MtaA/CmuA family methyltransferase [Actinomycetota bacterium]
MKILRSNMTPREIILNILSKKEALRCGVANPVSSTTIKQMEIMNSFFPDAHYDAKKMYELSRANYEILEYDAIMPVFSVVIEAYALGCKVDWGRPDMMPQILGKLWKSYEDIDINKDFLSNHAAKAVLECISLLKSNYPDVTIIGKVFGPWTLSYDFFGVEDFLIKTILEPDEVKSILNKLSEVTVKFANAQIEAGADVITVADHATMDLCSPMAYRDFLIPIHSMLVKEIKAPILLHICGDTLDRIEYICQTNVAAFHFESKVDACKAVNINNGRIKLIGNINNPLTLLFKKPEDVRKEVEYAIKCGVNIIGPECAVPLTTPLENLKEISKTVKNYKY